MAGYNPHNYMNPNAELRRYNGEYYMYTPTKTQDYDWGSVGMGGTVEKIANPLAAGYTQNDLNNTYNAVIDPTTWANNGKYTPDEIKSNVQKTFSGFDPNNTTGWQSQLDTLTKQATDLYNQDPTRQDKIFGDVWNTFRYNPVNDQGIQTIQAANNQPRPEFTSQEQAGVYGQTGKLTTNDERIAMVQNNSAKQSTTQQVMNSGDFAVAYKQKFGTDPTSQEITDWVVAGRPPLDTITPNKAPSGGVSYTIKAGDTLSQIARKFNTSIEAIMAANPSIKNPNLIYSNQTIQVPGVNSGVDKQEFLNSIQNKITEDLKKFTDTKTIFKTDGENSFNKGTKDSESVTEFKMPTSSSDLYNKLVNTEEIKGMKNKLTEYQKELDTLDAEELAMEGDIRKQIEGEAPNSVIRAMVAEKVRALYPKKLAIQAEAKAVQTQLSQALENAKQEYTMKLQDKENGLKYLDTLVSGGVKLTAEQYKIADQALGLGDGFAKSYFITQSKKIEEKPIEVNGQLVQKQPDGSYKVVFGEAKKDLPASAKEYEYAVSQGYKGTYEQYQNADANRKKSVVNNIIGNSGMNSKQQATFQHIVDKYNASPLIQASDRTPVLKSAITAIQSDPSNGANQLNLSYAYIQALDTYQSAVREGELGLVNSIDSKIGKITNSIQQIQNGQVVRPEVAKEIAAAAQNLVNTISNAASAKSKSFESNANVSGVGDAWKEYTSGFNSTFETDTSVLKKQVNEAITGGKLKGADGYISPQSYNQLKNVWVNQGGSISEFDNIYSSLKNPKNTNY